MKLDPVAFTLNLMLALAIAAVAGFTEILALNGVMGGKASTAIVIFLVFLSAGVVLTSLSAGWAARALTGKYGWKRLGACALSVAGGCLLMIPVAFVSVLLSILLAGIR